MAQLALWGGVECTVNRVGDCWSSQIDRLPGALTREHLEAIAGLGIRTLRFPILWERTCPDGETPDWRWADTRMAWLRELGIEPIVGLVHHGSGPRATSLVDPEFPSKLARFARSVAERYPWVTAWTPVNEPLTTARFSGMYGLWYPHGRDEATFRATLFHQVRGTIEAMRAIEAVVPGAQLVQTDDLGRTSSTPRIAYQARFQDHLRWLGWDLACGRVDRTHVLHRWLSTRCGATREALAWFVDNARAPDLVGINHYVTSDRFLDERLALYPPERHGGNGRHRYVDVEAARAVDDPSPGIAPLLVAAWQRYRIPVAITEAHLGGPREEQLRWMSAAWQGALEACAAGADVRAVTAWCLLGGHDWNSLCTRAHGYYESGAFDLRGGAARPTAVATWLRDTAAGRDTAALPGIAGAGWWQRPSRLLHRACRSDAMTTTESRTGDPRPPILITGGSGTLGRAFARMCAERDLAHHALFRNDLDIADEAQVERMLDRLQPWAIVNAAGYVRVDDAERDADRCFRENTHGAECLAAACARRGIRFVTFSTDLVFDGHKHAPYVEDDAPAPLNVYGRSKADAEVRVLERHPDALVVRTSAFFGPWDEYNFVSIALRHLRGGEVLEAAEDMFVSPTYVPDLVNVCLDLVIDGERGLCHLTNGEQVSWAEFAMRAAASAQVDARSLRRTTMRSMRTAAARPGYSVLRTTPRYAMPALDDALRRFVADATLD